MKSVRVIAALSFLALMGCAEPPAQSGMITADQVRARLATDDPKDQVGLAGNDDALLVRAASIYIEVQKRDGKAPVKFIGSDLRRVYTCVFNRAQPVPDDWMKVVCGDVLPYL